MRFYIPEQDIPAIKRGSLVESVVIIRKSLLVDLSICRMILDKINNDDYRIGHLSLPSQYVAIIEVFINE